MAVESPVLISVHIPKTGGTAFRDLLHRVYGDRILFDYGDLPLSAGAAWRRFRNRLSGRPRIPESIACIHGHFLATKYERRFPHARYAVWLRDPAERLISQYYHWHRHPDPHNSTCRALLQNGLDLREFAGLPRMRNVEARFLSSKEIETFDFVGITEDFDRGISLFQAVFGIEADWTGFEANVNTQKSGARYEIDPDTRRVIESYNEEDRLIYSRAQRRFQELYECHVSHRRKEVT